MINSVDKIDTVAGLEDPFPLGLKICVTCSVLGHSDINLTMSRYSHSYREDEKQAVERLPDLSKRPAMPVTKDAQAG